MRGFVVADVRDIWSVLACRVREKGKRTFVTKHRVMVGNKPMEFVGEPISML